MSILMADSFDFYNGPTDMAYVGSPWSNVGVNPSTLTPYSDGRSMFFNSGTLQSNAFPSAASPNTNTTIYIHFDLMCNTAFTGGQNSGLAFDIIDASATSVVQVQLNFSNDGNLYVRNNCATGYINWGTIIGTFPHGMAANSWANWQIKLVINNTTGSVEVRKNNNSVNDYTLSNVNTRTGTTNNYANMFLFMTSGGPGWYIDNIFVCSGDATVPNTWPTQLRAIQIMPNADTAQKDLTPSTGVNNYACVDEVQMNSDTDYVYGSTAGNTDLYDLTNLSVSPLSIPLVVVRQAFKKSDTGARSGTTRVKSGAAASDGATVLLAVTYQWQNTYLTTDPNTTLAWSLSGVNALQVGPKVVA